jgi:hypothetical protein
MALYYPRIHLNVLRRTTRNLIRNIRYPNPRFQPGSYRRTKQECLYTQWQPASGTCNELADQEDDFLLSCLMFIVHIIYHSGYVMFRVLRTLFVCYVIPVSHVVCTSLIPGVIQDFRFAVKCVQGCPSGFSHCFPSNIPGRN